MRRPRPPAGGTDPKDGDSDDDGLTDGLEINVLDTNPAGARPCLPPML